MNAFSNDRFIIARDLIGSHYPLLVLAHSLLVLVSFAAARAGVTQCSYINIIKENKGGCKESTIRGHRKNLSPRWDSNPRLSVF